MILIILNKLMDLFAIGVVGAGTFSGKSLSDVIIGYRRPNTDHKQYLSRVLALTRQELASKDF